MVDVALNMGNHSFSSPHIYFIWQIYPPVKVGAGLLRTIVQFQMDAKVAASQEFLLLTLVETANVVPVLAAQPAIPRDHMEDAAHDMGMFYSSVWLST
jgi:hypothetical protein